MSDILAELGLAGEATEATEAKRTEAVAEGGGAAPAAETTTETAQEGSTAKQERKQIKIATVSTGVASLLPASKRGAGFGGGERGSKYPFEDLAAPTDAGYSFFTVNLSDTDAEDEKALRSAVQSAVSARNKKAKEDGKEEKYVTRTNTDDAGAFTGVSVYRVDNTLDDDAE